MGANVSFHNVKSLRLDPVARNENEGRVWYSRGLWLYYEDGTGAIVLIHGATAEALTSAGEPAPEEWKPVDATMPEREEPKPILKKGDAVVVKYGCIIPHLLPPAKRPDGLRITEVDKNGEAVRLSGVRFPNHWYSTDSLELVLEEVPPFRPGQEVECVMVRGCVPPLTQGKRYFVNRVYKNHDCGEWFVGLGCDAKNGWFAWRFKAVSDLTPDNSPKYATACHKCGCAVSVTVRTDVPTCPVCEERAKQAVDELRAKMVDPLYIPTLPEALADPAGFVEAMRETGGES